MISYHPLQDFSRTDTWHNGFKFADVMDMERISKCMSSFVWSPCIWENGVRKEIYYLSAQFCAMDFDDGEMSLEDAKNIFCDMRHIIGTTKSHQEHKSGAPPCDRFRVVLVFERPITDVKIYRHNMIRMMKNYPIDKKCKDGARYFFPCKEIVSINTDGYFQEIDTNIEIHNRKRTPPKFSGVFNQIPLNYIRTFERQYKLNNRNNAIYYLANRGAEVGLDPLAVRAILDNTQAFKIVESLGEDEIMRTIQSAFSGVSR